MAKRVFLIHGWEGYPEEGWRPWLKSELEKKGFQVIVPAMPDTQHPKMGAWLNHLVKTVGLPDKGCYFVGHSLGCIIMHRNGKTPTRWKSLRFPACQKPSVSEHLGRSPFLAS